MLEYDSIQDFSYNPFTCKCTPISVGYDGANCEVRTIPNSSPYFVKMYHAPIENSPSYTDIYIGATQLTEIAATQCPANNQYRVNYVEKGRGIAEFHPNQKGCEACLCYCHVGTMLSKDALDVRLNVYCGVNCALCAYASACCAIYACASNSRALYAQANYYAICAKTNCNYGIYTCAGLCYGFYSRANCDYGIQTLAVRDIGIHATANRCVGIYASAGCNFGLQAMATCCYGICSCANCFGIWSSANDNLGVVGVSANFYGVCGCSACYGVCGVGTTARPVSGNGAYHDSVSNRNLKVNKESVCILDCYKANPDFKVQKWQYSDTNQKGFDYFISPYAEDIRNVFGLTYEDSGIYQLDGIALGASVELYHRLIQVENRLQKLERCA